MWGNEARETLFRTAVLLLSLAGLAERAASVSPHRRRVSLYILRQGEFAALGALIDLMAHPPATLSFEAYWDAVESDDPEDALLLAARLRFLGLAIAHTALAARNATSCGGVKRTTDQAGRLRCLITPAAGGTTSARPAFIDSS